MQTDNAVVIRFSGDSGDGMQLAGQQFTQTMALSGQYIYTCPDYPAEIRSPAGTQIGVSGFQARVSEDESHFAGDAIDILIAMNPAALCTHAKALKAEGILLYNSDQFQSKDYQKAEVSEDYLDTFKTQQRIAVPLTELTRKSVAEYDISHSQAARCKNMFALGVVFWLFDRKLDHTIENLRQKFSASPTICDANIAALQAGLNFAETSEYILQRHHLPSAKSLTGHYQHVTGNTAFALGCITAGVQASRSLFFSGYPITPASTLLQQMTQYSNFDLKVFQAEDEIAAACAAMGAAYGGSLAATCTSGPGLDLKAESLGLAVMSELPLVVFNIQRAGPATGMPTKPEQSDLLAAVMGRHGEAPIPVLAPATPADCFAIALQAFEIAVRYMTPVIVLSDASLAHGAEPWAVPDVDTLFAQSQFAKEVSVKSEVFARNKQTLAPAWITPGMTDKEHVIGGLEKDMRTGGISYDADNHQKMVKTRQEKIRRARTDFPRSWREGPEQGELLLVSWGSPYGTVSAAAKQARDQGRAVSVLQLRGVWPLPANLAEILSEYQKVLVVEMNLGQLHQLLQAEVQQPLLTLQQLTGEPFQVQTVLDKIAEVCA